jgi:hypothetical protein
MTNSKTKLITAALTATLIIAPFTGLASNSDEAARKQQHHNYKNEGDDALRKKQINTIRENEGDDARRIKQDPRPPIQDDRLPKRK